MRAEERERAEAVFMPEEGGREAAPYKPCCAFPAEAAELQSNEPAARVRSQRGRRPRRLEAARVLGSAAAAARAPRDSAAAECLQAAAEMAAASCWPAPQ
eukprot:SM005510S18183  [mRNA]  locus=s5510:313:696:- [translate_table: standard]